MKIAIIKYHSQLARMAASTVLLVLLISTPAQAQEQAKPKSTGYIVESQEECSVILLVPKTSELTPGDVIVFQDVATGPQPKGRRQGSREIGRIMKRTASPKAGHDVLNLTLAQRNRPKCGLVKDFRIRPMELPIMRQFSVPWLDLTMDLSLVLGLGLETWNVAEDASGTVFSVGSMFTLELPRPGRFGIAFHSNLLLERASLRNQKVVIVGADAEITTTRGLAGLGAGLVYYLDRRGLARAEGLIQVETSLFGSLQTKVFGESIKRDYRIGTRITPALRFDYTLFSLMSLGLMAGYSLLDMEIENSDGKMQQIDGHSWSFVGTLAYRL